MATIQDIQSLFVFPHNDIRLKVLYIGEPIIAYVSSTAMCLANPVWESIIFSPVKSEPQGPFSMDTSPAQVSEQTVFTQAKSEQEDTSSIDPFATHVAKKRKIDDTGFEEGELPDKELRGRELPKEMIDFANDDGEALLILLRVAHLQFEQLPARLTNDELYNLTVLCNQYSCIKLILPWVHGWFSGRFTEKTNASSWFKFLCILWALKEEVRFRELATEMVWHMTVNKRGRHVIRYEKQEYENSGSVLLPPGILESIFDVRNRVVDDILQALYDKLTPEGTLCKQPQAKNFAACNALVRGSLEKHLISCGLWPRKAPENVTLSIKEISEKLNNFAYKSSHGPSCGKITIKSLISAKTFSLPDPVLYSHVKHFRE